MNNENIQLKKQKLLAEIESAKRIKKLGIHPLDILDDLIDNITEFLKIGILEKYPDANEEEIMEKLHELVILDKKIRKKNIR